MAFSDDLTRNLKSEKGFWAIIEDTFIQVEGVLFGYRVEAKEEALTGALRIREEGTPIEARRAASFDIAESTRTTTAATTS
jgi:hypothetical protein